MRKGLVQDERTPESFFYTEVNFRFFDREKRDKTNRRYNHKLHTNQVNMSIYYQIFNHCRASIKFLIEVVIIQPKKISIY